MQDISSLEATVRQEVLQYRKDYPSELYMPIAVSTVLTCAHRIFELEVALSDAFVELGRLRTVCLPQFEGLAGEPSLEAYTQAGKALRVL
jgi:hypothetical protein